MTSRILARSLSIQKTTASAVALAAALLTLGCLGLGTGEAPSGAEATGHPSGLVADPADWCGGCGLPESMCTVCNPELIEQFKASGDWCPEHGFPESVCPKCNPMQPPGAGPGPGSHAPETSAGKTAGTVIRFSSPAIEAAAGIATVPATTGSLGIDVECTASVDFDHDVTADIRSPVEGIVREVRVDLGQQVAAGDRLFTLESADVGDLQAGHSAAAERVEAARANLARQEVLLEEGLTSQRGIELARQDFEEAEAELQSIEQSLRLSGAGRDGDGRYAIRAPIAGTVVRRPTLVGTYASEADSLATVADTSVMWALLDVPEWDASVVRVGQQVDLHVDGVAGHTFSGAISWVASEVDPTTRAVTARARIDNPDRLLRAGQFARATVRVAGAEDAATVPTDAVQRLGDESVVFVRVAQGLYEPRTVTLGRSDGRRVHVSGEIQEGDAVVTTGAFLLRTELSRESIGAGCCEVEGPGGR